MKKLFVLVAALLLVGLVAAAQATVTGKVEIRGINDFEDEIYAPNGVVELKFDADIDDNTSVYVEIEEGPTQLDYFPNSPFDRAHFTVDVGAVLGLPVGVVVRAGYDEYKIEDNIKVTKGEYEDEVGVNFKSWGYKIDVQPVMDYEVFLRFVQGDDWDTEELIIGAYGTIEPVMFEIDYAIATDVEADAGVIEFGAEYNTEVADGIALGVASTGIYALDAAAGAPDLQYAAGVDVNYMEDLARLGVAFRGETDAEAGALAIYLSSAPAEGFEAFLSVGIAIDEAFATDNVDVVESLETGLDSVDFGISYAIGGSTWYLGYFHSVEGGNIGKEWAEFSAPSDRTDPAEAGLGAVSAIYLRAKAEF